MSPIKTCFESSNLSFDAHAAGRNKKSESDNRELKGDTMRWWGGGNAERYPRRVAKRTVTSQRHSVCHNKHTEAAKNNPIKRLMRGDLAWHVRVANVAQPLSAKFTLRASAEHVNAPRKTNSPVSWPTAVPVLHRGRFQRLLLRLKPSQTTHVEPAPTSVLD